MPVDEVTFLRLVREATHDDLQERAKLLAVLNQDTAWLSLEEHEFVPVLRQIQQDLEQGEVESGTGEAEIRDASTISTRALDLLIQAAKVIVQYNVEDPSPEQLFMVSEHTRETPTGWDRPRIDLERRKYVDVLQRRIPAACSRFKLHALDARNRVTQNAFDGMDFAVCASNDVLIVPRRFYNSPENGALAGLLVKEQLSWQEVRQAQAQWLLFANNACFPFCQFATDFRSGGIACYCSAKQSSCDVMTCRVIKGMDSFWKFYATMLESLPSLLADDEVATAAELEQPKRYRFKWEEGGSRSEFLRQLVAYYNNWDDVANMSDLQNFDELAGSAGHA